MDLESNAQSQIVAGAPPACRCRTTSSQGQVLTSTQGPDTGHSQDTARTPGRQEIGPKNKNEQRLPHSEVLPEFTTRFKQLQAYHIFSFHMILSNE